MAVPRWLLEAENVRHHRRRSATSGEVADWPQWVPDEVRGSLSAQGVTALWRHQAYAAELAHAGRHTFVCTGTASGKTMAYLLPVLSATYGGEQASPPDDTGRLAGTRRAAAVRELLQRPHTALYLAPTKALAHDQLRLCRGLGLSRWRIGPLDGDCDDTERRWAREHASFLLTNPDMLHHGVLPDHQRWGGFLQHLRYVVVDEAHSYRGLFGAHVAQVLRRLRRICRAHGADPVFILSSATIGNPDDFGAALIAEDDIAVVGDSFAPRPARDVVLWQPRGQAGGTGGGIGRVHDQDAASLMARLVGEGHQVLTFVSSRAMAEVVAETARKCVDGNARIESYRAGYLPLDRRSLEAGLQSRTIAGIASTNALELGVDIAGMDAVIVSGYPGTRSALWQQAGRAGRGTSDALVVLVARPDPLDMWLLDHPDLVFSSHVESAVVFPENPHVLVAHLTAAAAEIPLVEDDARWFGPLTIPLLERLSARGTLRRRPTGWYWTKPQRMSAMIDLRAVGGRAVEIIDTDTGRVVGQVDPSAADRTVHPGAVYLHQGQTWLVDDLDHEDAVAMVHRAEVPYYTQARTTTEIELRRESRRIRCGSGLWCFGDVTLGSQVTAFLRRDAATATVWDETPLQLPRRALLTQATWWSLPEDAYASLGLAPAQLAGAAHAIEHAATSLLPAFVPCDRWDLGGLSTAVHPNTGAWTVFVYDRAPGGCGFAARAYADHDWLDAIADRLLGCQCPNGCPSCVVSPACDTGNKTLDKRSAAALITLLTGDR